MDNETTELSLYETLVSVMQAIDETKVVEFEILSQNRARYKDLLFSFDAVVGYAKDLRLIEYRVEDKYYERERGARKVIFIYRYGEHPAGTDGIIRREPGDPSGNWERFFPSPGGLQTDLLRNREARDRGRSNNQGAGGDYLPPTQPKTKLLE